MSIVTDILSRRKPHVQTTRLLLDGEIAAKIEEAKRQLARAVAVEKINSQGLASEVPLLQQRIVELGLEAEAASTAFIFKALDRVAFQELKRQYPPTAEQWERYREKVAAGAYWIHAPEFEEVVFAPALIAACCTDPAMTPSEALELWDGLSDGEAAALYAAALDVNEQASDRPFSGTGTVTTPNSGPDSTTPQNGDSPSLSLAEGS